MSMSIRLVALRLFLGLLAVGAAGAAWPDDGSDLSARYRAQVDRRLDPPQSEWNAYAALAQTALASAGIALSASQYLAVVDRSPAVQALLLFWRSSAGEWRAVGASPVSTGRPGSFDHFETPLGVFEHSTSNMDFRAEGTLNTQHVRGYGAKGLRVFDFGWQYTRKGWGDGAVSQMRLQMHATDQDLLERRLGTAQSKGCIRIPATLNRLLDHHGVLDADYEQAARPGHKLWVLHELREPVADAGRYLVVVESQRSERPDWSPAPSIAHRKPTAPVQPRQLR